MRTVYIIRHTEATHHVDNLGGGWYDSSLTEKGIGQANKIAESLRIEIKKQNIPLYSSDLKRCSEMADIFSRVFKSPVILDENLREMSLGDYEGQSKEWLAENIIFRPKDGNKLDHRHFKNAESRREVGTRASYFINQLLKKPDEDVIVITHGFFSTFLIMAWLKVPVEHMGYCTFYVSSGGVTILNEDPDFGERNVICVDKLDYLKD